VKGAGDGGGAQGEDVNLAALPLEVLLMGNAKALLFINDK